MFIIRKKHLSFILLSLFLSFSFCLLSENINQRNSNIIQVSALPIDKKVIVIDAGHGRRRWWSS